MNEQEYEARLDEKLEDIDFLVSILRQIYAIAGEDPEISRLCNKALDESRITISTGIS